MVSLFGGVVGCDEEGQDAAPPGVLVQHIHPVQDQEQSGGGGAQVIVDDIESRTTSGLCEDQVLREALPVDLELASQPRPEPGPNLASESARSSSREDPSTYREYTGPRGLRKPPAAATMRLSIHVLPTPRWPVPTPKRASAVRSSRANRDMSKKWSGSAHTPRRALKDFNTVLDLAQARGLSGKVGKHTGSRASPGEVSV